MSSISYTTFLVFIVLCPGFLFLTAFSVFGRLRIADNQHGAMFDVAAFVTISTLLHIVVGGIYFFTAEIFRPGIIETLFKLGEKTPEFPVSTAAILLFYAVIISIFSLGSGYYIITKIEDGSINTDILHGPYYNIVKGADAPVTTVSVLTNIYSANRFLIYEGILVEVSFLAYRRINHIVIRQVSRLLLKIGDEKVKITSEDDHTRIDDEDDVPSILVIPGDKIMNVVFRPQPITADRRAAPRTN
jgi:hypothetical protein